MSNYYGMLKDLVMEYHSKYSLYENIEITNLDTAKEANMVSERLNFLENQIFTFAMLYVDEREGVKDDI